MNTKTNNLTINISHRTIVFTTVFLVSLWFLYNIRDILIILLISFLVVVAINPLVDYLQKRQVPRGIGASIILIGIFLCLLGLAASLISPLIEQTQFFIQKLPSLLGDVTPFNLNVSSLTTNLSSVSGNVVRIAIDTFSGVITFFTLLVVSFYLIQSRPLWEGYTAKLFGDNAQRYYKILLEVETKLGHWVRGVLVLMLVVGMANYLGFVLIDLPYAVPLGVIAGVLEILPNIGPTVAAIPAAIVGFSISPTHGAFALFVSIIVQQLENYLLVPMTMKRATGLHPVVTIFAILIGFRLGGPLVAVLSLPILLAVQTIYTHLHYNFDKKQPEIV